MTLERIMSSFFLAQYLCIMENNIDHCTYDHRVYKTGLPVRLAIGQYYQRGQKLYMPLKACCFMGEIAKPQGKYR
jgi:hypothetical protein